MCTDEARTLGATLLFFWKYEKCINIWFKANLKYFPAWYPQVGKVMGKCKANNYFLKEWIQYPIFQKGRVLQKNIPGLIGIHLVRGGYSFCVFWNRKLHMALKDIASYIWFTICNINRIPNTCTWKLSLLYICWSEKAESFKFDVSTSLYQRYVTFRTTAQTLSSCHICRSISFVKSSVLSLSKTGNTETIQIW